MKERPILFSAPMVRALLEGRKTQTRRVCKVQPPADALWGSNGAEWMWLDDRDDTADRITLCPYGVVGDRLWVKETHTFLSWDENGHVDIEYPADGAHASLRVLVDDFDVWIEKRARHMERSGAVVVDGLLQMPEGVRTPSTPSLFMQRWASRITLEVTGVRVERLNAISTADAIAEGIAPISCSALWWNYLDKGRVLTRPESSFRSLWERINGAGSWDANPWVWVVEFKAVQP